jgi:non-heme chloroperoxidase
MGKGDLGMPYIEVEKDVNLYYEEAGNGQTIIFIHGVWMSSRFFQQQLNFFKKDFHTILLDLRGHGESSKPAHGNTINGYAKDLHNFMTKKDLKDVVLVGWSMGAFVVWEYLKEFGEENIKGTVIVDEMASDFKWEDYPQGAFDMNALIDIMRAMQTDRVGFLKGFLPLMFKEEMKEETLTWMLEETTKMSESIAGAVLFDQTVVDYRSFFSSIKTPTLLCFGKEEKLIPVAAGEEIHREITNSRLEIFEDSCHCPFFEETDRFNEVVSTFVKELL